MHESCRLLAIRKDGFDAVSLSVVPERAVHVLVAVARQQDDLQRIARLDAVAVLG